MWVRTLVGIVIVIVVGAVGLFLYWTTGDGDSQYDVIAAKWTASGKFIDYAKDLGVDGVEDIMYYVDKEDKVVEILYGYVTLKYTFSQMKTQDVQYALEYIGITYDIKKSGDDFRLYWCGEEMGECYKSPSVG